VEALGIQKDERVVEPLVAASQTDADPGVRAGGAVAGNTGDLRRGVADRRPARPRSGSVPPPPWRWQPSPTCAPPNPAERLVNDPETDVLAYAARGLAQIEARTPSIC
jgi:hypothetical protein